MNLRMQRGVLEDTETSSSAGLCVLQNSVLKLWLAARTAWFMESLLTLRAGMGTLNLKIEKAPKDLGEPKMVLLPSSHLCLSQIFGRFMESFHDIGIAHGDHELRSAKLQLRAIMLHRAELELRAPIRFMERALS